MLFIFEYEYLGDYLYWLRRKETWKCRTILWPILLKWWSRLLTQDVSLIRCHVCAVLLRLVQSERSWFSLQTRISIPWLSRTLSVTIVEFLCCHFLLHALLSMLPVVEWLGWTDEVGWMELTSNSVRWGRLFCLFLGSKRGQKVRCLQENEAHIWTLCEGY